MYPLYPKNLYSFVKLRIKKTNVNYFLNSQML
nr:MAG TPA_asm: hypothetical protein [Caudoviricetes sp.]